MGADMIQEVEEYCRRNGLIEKGDKIVIGLIRRTISVIIARSMLWTEVFTKLVLLTGMWSQRRILTI